MGLFLVKKLETQEIITMIMFTRSSERIFNPSHYTGKKYRKSNHADKRR